MATSIFVNLPVRNVAVSRSFFEALGFNVNEKFSNEVAACIVVSDVIYLMLLDHPTFATFTTKTIIDASSSTGAIVSLMLESREGVDVMADRALAAGGSYLREPEDHGFMYGRSFQDPDGNLFEVGYLDPAAA
jgi:predicted lactoylglutathione lyase